MHRAALLCLTVALALAGPALAQDREAKVRADRKKIEAEGFWIYNDLANGGSHGAAQRAGFRKGDILVSFDRRTDLKRETDVIAHALNAHPPGDKVPVTVLRDGKEVSLTLPMQN